MMVALLLAFAGAALLVQWVTIALFLRRLAPSKPRVGSIGLPKVTLLRPVCGLDPFDAETLGSSFVQNYPDYDIIFCAPSADDASVPLVRALIAAHPERKASLLVGQSAITGNPKLNNLYKGWQAAEADFVCMTDSNLLLTPDYLRAVVTSWTNGTGLVSCPPIGTQPEGLAGSLECAFLNGNQARLQFASDSLGQGFAQGKTLFWNRAMLNREGGLAAIGNYLAEDVNATKLVRARGLKVRLTALPFAQPIGRRSFSQVWSRQLRWSRVRRDGFPLIFASEIANGPALPLSALAVAAALGGLPVPPALTVYAGLWYGAEALLMRRAGWPSGLLDHLALPLRDVLMPVLWATTFLRRDIEWRGTALSLPSANPVDVAEVPAE